MLCGHRMLYSYHQVVRIAMSRSLSNILVHECLSVKYALSIVFPNVDIDYSILYYSLDYTLLKIMTIKTTSFR